MKDLESILKVVSDGLKTLAKGVEAIAEKVDEAAKTQGSAKPKSKKPTAAAKKGKAAKKPVRKTAGGKKAGPPSASDTVLDIISRSKKGVGTAIIIEKTGYDRKKVANIIYRLNKQGKIKSVEKGVYTKK